jgi:hypothetical protein
MFNSELRWNVSKDELGVVYNIISSVEEDDDWHPKSGKNGIGR